MTGQDFLRVTSAAFGPFLVRLGFEMGEPTINGRYYETSFSSKTHVVSISFEPGDYELFVMVFGRKGKQLSDIDDPRETPRLGDLKKRYMASVSAEERAENDAFFRSIVVNDKREQELLRAARDLRLVLPKYLRVNGNLSEQPGFEPV